MSHRSTTLYLDNPRYYESFAVMYDSLAEREQRLLGIIASIDAELNERDLTMTERFDLSGHRATATLKLREVRRWLEAYAGDVS